MAYLMNYRTYYQLYKDSDGRFYCYDKMHRKSASFDSMEDLKTAIRTNNLELLYEKPLEGTSSLLYNHSN